MSFVIKKNKKGSWLFAFDDKGERKGCMFMPADKKLKAKKIKKPNDLKSKEQVS